MSASLYIDRGILESRVALIEDGQIAEIHIERVGEKPLRGQIRRGRVKHISNDLQAATVDIGDGVALFLRAADARVLGPEDAQGRIPIAKLLTRGQTVLVQPTRPGVDGKQGRCTADIALFGRYVTVHPMRRGIEPGKAGTDSVAAALTTLAEKARITLRPAARMVPDADVVAETERLLAQWEECSASVKGPPAMLRPAQDLLARALTALAGPDPDVVLVPDRSLLADIRQLAATVAPDLKDRIELAEARRAVDLDEEIEAALAAEAVFEGGRLTIEPTRAMTVIDVDGQGPPTRINLTAVPEIARQLRLRRIGGQVAIDFVTMSKTQDRKRVETALRQALQKAVPQVEIGVIDRFGIATLALRRDGRSLVEEIAELPSTVPALRPEAQLARVLRRVSLELSDIGPLPVVIALSDRLKDAAPDDLAEQLSRLLSRPLKVTYGDRAIDDYALSRER